MMIQMVDKANTSLIGQDGETLTFKALLYSNVAVHVQICRLFCVVYIPLLSLVQLGYLACEQALPLKGLVTSQEKKSLQRSHSFFSSAHH